MRRLVLVTAVLFGSLAASAGAASHAVSISGFAFSPGTVNIAAGDNVVWTWAGPDTNHSVTSKAGQSGPFDSDPGGPPTAVDHPPGDTFEHVFPTAGTFLYACKVHPSMQGRVVVSGPAGGGGDTTPPAISSLKASPTKVCPRKPKRCKRTSTRVTYRLSEAASVTATVTRRKRERSVTAAGHKGTNKLDLSALKLAKGGYRLKLVATDAAGNKSTASRTGFAVRR